MILQGDALTELRKLDSNMVDMCITSPPYYGLRDYGTATWEGGDEDCEHTINSPDPDNLKPHVNRPFRGNRSACIKCGAKRIDQQMGLEDSIDEYITKLCDVFDEVGRVLKDEGTCWVNIGDSYNSHSAKSKKVGGFEGRQMSENPDYAAAKITMKKTGVPDKCLLGIPFRFALEMIDRGWILRNTIIWHKPNCMPSSAKDRFTVDFEYLFFFTHQQKYYFETQYEPYKSCQRDLDRFDETLQRAQDHNRTTGDLNSDEYKPLRAKRMPAIGGKKHKGKHNATYSGNTPDWGKGRIKRAVWTIPPASFKGPHYATFPPKLIETPIAAGCPEQICKKCGLPRKQIVETSYNVRAIRTDKSKQYNPDDKYVRKNMPFMGDAIREIKGYTDCGCNAGFEPGIVLDCFFGSGTTGLVALEQGKKYIGIELNPKDIKIAEERLGLNLFDGRLKNEGQESKEM